MRWWFFLLSNRECLFIKRSSQPRLALKPSSEESNLTYIRIIRRDTRKWREHNLTIHSNSSSSISTLSGFFPAPSSLFLVDFFFIAASWSFWLHHTRILLASTLNWTLVQPLPSKIVPIVQLLSVWKKHRSFSSFCSSTSYKIFTPPALHFPCGIKGVTIDGAVPRTLITWPLFLNKERYPPPPLNETGFYSREASIRSNMVLAYPD